MSVLENLRKGTDSASTRVLMGVVAFALIAFFSGATGGSDSTSILATVNGTAITSSEVQRAMRMVAAQRRKQPTQEDMAQIQQEAIDQLITQEVLLQEADRLGIQVSPEEVARVIARNENFYGADGKFDQKVYDRFLKQTDLTGARYEHEIERQILIEKVAWIALRGVNVSDAEVKAAWTEEQTSLALTYVRLPTAAFLADVTVTDAERDEYVAKNGDALKKEYDESFERRFNLPKRYTLRTILLRTDLPGMDDAAKEATRARAEEIQKLAAGGADFGDLARRWSEDLTATRGGDLGTLAAGQLDPQLVAAADQTGAGKVSAVVSTGRGFQVVKVEAIEEARQVPFEEARNELAVEKLKEDRVLATTRAHAEKIIAAWTPSGPPVELVEPKSLPVASTLPFSLQDPPTAPPVAKMPELALALRSAPAGAVLPTPFAADGAVFVVALDQRTTPDESAFEAGKALTRARLLYQRRGAFLDEWVQAAKARASIELPGQATSATN